MIFGVKQLLSNFPWFFFFYFPLYLSLGNSIFNILKWAIPDLPFLYLFPFFSYLSLFLFAFTVLLFPAATFPFFFFFFFFFSSTSKLRQEEKLDLTWISSISVSFSCLFPHLSLFGIPTRGKSDFRIFQVRVIFM